MRMVLQIDFDGVLHKSSKGYGDGKIYDEPCESAAFTMNNLAEVGYELQILTARPKVWWPKMELWLKKHGFPKMKITNTKVPARAYIDDKAIRFTSWSDLSKYFL